jgi:hypothetical protein
MVMSDGAESGMSEWPKWKGRKNCGKAKRRNEKRKEKTRLLFVPNQVGSPCIRERNRIPSSQRARSFPLSSSFC